jgi:hypothetical protein
MQKPIGGGRGGVELVRFLHFWLGGLGIFGAY